MTTRCRTPVAQLLRLGGEARPGAGVSSGVGTESPPCPLASLQDQRHWYLHQIPATAKLPTSFHIIKTSSTCWLALFKAQGPQTHVLTPGLTGFGLWCPYKGRTRAWQQCFICCFIGTIAEEPRVVCRHFCARLASLNASGSLQPAFKAAVFLLLEIL